MHGLNITSISKTILVWNNILPLVVDLKARCVWTIYQISFSQVWYLFILPRHLLEMRKFLSQETQEREAGQGSIKQENCILQSLSNTLQTSNPCSHSSCMKWFQSFLSFSWSINQRSLIQNGNIVIKRNRERERITREGKLNFGISPKHCTDNCSHISCKWSFLTFISTPHPAEH